MLVDVVPVRPGALRYRSGGWCGHRRTGGGGAVPQAGQALDEGDVTGALAFLDRAARRPPECPNRCAACCSARPGRSARPPTRSVATAGAACLDGAGDLRVARARTAPGPGRVFAPQSVDRPGNVGSRCAALPFGAAAGAASRRPLRPPRTPTWRPPHLTMPMTEASSQLRLGVTQRSRALGAEGLHREDHPEQWASVQLNLANSLVYTPSNHQADNRFGAVELYEAVLAARDRHTGPGPGAGVGRIRAMCAPTSATSTRPGQTP